MPDNILYSVQLPDGRTTQWSQNQYEKAKDDLFAKYPEASVIRTSAYNPEDTDVSASDKFDIQLPDGRKTQWTQEQFSKAGADLMTKYPDAQIVKTSDMSTQYWEPKMQEAKQRLDEFNAQHGQFMKEYEFNKGLADSLELEGVTQSGEHDFVAANDAQYQPLSRQREQLRKAYYGNPLVAGQFKANAEAAGKLNEEYMARADDADTGADRRDWKRAAKLQDDIRKLYDAPNKYIEELDGSNGFAKFLKDYRAGAGDVFSDKDFWTRGLTEIARNIDLRGIAKKMEDAANASPEGLSEEDVDRILTPGEKAQIMSFYRLAEAQKDRAENISGGYTAGGSFAESLGFMAEFMLSSGLANVAGKALSTSSKGLASWLGRELMSERALNRAIEKGVTVATDFSKMNRGAKAARLADEIVAKPIVQGLWHTGTQVGTLATISDGLMDTDSNGQLISLGRSVLNGVLDSVVENWSESVGNAFELPFKGIGAIGKKTLGNTGFGKWARWFYNTAPTQVLREAGFNGMIGEMAEEWAGNAVRVGLGLMSPEEFKDFASWEQQLEMAASFAPMSLIGLGTSSYSAIRHSKDYDRLAGQVQDILQRQGVDQNDIDVLFRTKFDTPEDIAKKFAPYLRSISMDAQSPTAKEDYKTMLDFAKEVGIKTVVDEMDQMDQADKRNDMREVISGTTGRFWQEFDSPEAKDADGNPLRIQQVRVLEYADGHPVFIIGGGQDVEGQQEALLATVDESGKKGFIKQSDIDVGIADGTITSDSGMMMLDDYLQQRVDATNRDAEAQRMAEETRQQVGAIRATISADPNFNMGTEESPVPATVTAFDANGVHVVFNSPENGQGETDLTWKELGDYLGTPVSVKTDEQIEADAAAARDEAQQRLRDIQMITPGTEITVRLGEGETAEEVRYPFQQAIMDDGQIMVYYLDENGDSKQVSEEMVVNLPELTELAKAEVPAEAAAAEEPASEESGEVSDDGVPRDFRGNEIPLLKNGEVNRDAFFKNDTEAWARWNDEQNQDGGADSIQTIQAAMAKVSSDLAKAQAEHDKMSSPGDRYAKKGQIEAMNNRLAELQGILDGYAPAEAAVEAEEEAGGTSAEPAQSSSPSERIPKDKKGNMLFEKAPVEDTAAYLLELAGNDLKLAMSTARSMNKQVRGDIRKAEKAKVKGDNPVQIIQNTRQKEQKIQEMQARADYWNEVVENLRRRQEAALAAANRAERDLNEPQRLEEAVANYLATLEPNSLDRADFQRELGWGKSEMQAFFRLWAKSGAGRSLNRVAEDMAADDQTGFVPTDATGKKDIQAVRNAIINVMNEVSGPGELKNYTRNANLERLAEMAEFLEAEEARIEEAVEEAEPAQMGNEDMPDFENAALSDNLGNPVDPAGNLVIEQISDINELTDEDFTAPSRSVALPVLPDNVDAAIGGKGRATIIKKSVFEKNAKSHSFSPAESREILRSSLYNPNIVGQSQPLSKPLHWIAIRTGDKSNITVVEVNESKDNIEVVSWFNMDARNLERMKRQAEREGGELLLLDSTEPMADSLPALPSDLSSESKDSENSGNTSISDQIEAARQEVDTNPTDAQKEAGNYKKGHITLDGYEISIENPKGSIRRGTDAKGNEWQVEMNNDYGYIRMTEGPDGDHIDVFLSDNPTEGNVFVVDQVNPETGEFDEHKVMYGFPDAESARAAYLANYSEGWQGLGTITEVTKEEFKKWIESSHRKTKPFSEYKSVTPLGAQNEAREPAGTETAEETPEERAERVTNEAIAFATGQTVEEIEAQREAEEQAAETEQPAEAEKAEENEPAAEETATETAPTAEAGQEKAEEGQEKSVEERAAELAASIAEKTRQYNELYSAWLRDASMTAEQRGENQRQRRELEYERRQLESELVSLMMSMSAEQRGALRIGASDAMNDALDKVEAKLAETRKISRIASAIQRFQKVIRTKAKALGKLNLYSFTLADENRPAMGGVLHDKGFAVASNTQILIADKESYDKKKEGKLIDKAGKEIKQKYPKWRELIPAESKTAKMNFGELRDFLASVKAQREADWEREKAEGRKVDAKKKYVDDTKILLNIGEDTTIAFKLGLLSSFADTAERFGAKELLYQDARRMVAVKTKKGIAMLMPVMVEFNSEQFDSIEDFARDRAETWSWYSFGENELQKNDAEASKPARQQKTTDEAVAFVTGSTAEDVAAERESEKTSRLQKRIAKWKKLLGNTFEVITDINDVRDEQARQEIEKADAAVAAGEPREDNKVSGWFLPSTNKAYIYLPHISDEADLDRSILHEVIAHKGIRALFPTEAEFNKFLDYVYNNVMTAEDRAEKLKYVGAGTNVPGGIPMESARAAADEFIADAAERNTSIVKQLDDSVWNRIVEAVKRIIEDMVGQDIWEADVDVVTPFDSILRDSLAEFVKARPAPVKKTETKAKTSSRGSKKIEDFGEKIGGARKDMVRSKVNDTAKLSSSDLKTLGSTDKILSAANVIKSFHKGEMDEKTARIFLALGQVAKRKMYGSTLVLLTKYRDLALAWANGQEVKMEITEHDIDVYASQYNERVTSQPNFRERVKQDLEYILNGSFYHYMHTYELMNFPAVERKLGSYVIRVPREDEKGDKRIFVKSSWDAMRGYVFKTEEEAVSWLDKQCPAIVIKEASGKSEEGEEKAKYGSLDVVKDQYGWYRVKSRLTPGSIFLSKKFSTREAAEKYLEENHVDLEERERQLVSSLLGSNIGSVEREGPDYRGGADVTEDEFQKAFGTRGVEFGNWVPQRERQLYLNKTYDAIMDLAEILGISPKAFTHGGRLALAFGARGKSRALAHYEPMKEVINLTRMSGAGSLAHEWWHSFDNYMSRIPTGSALAFATKTRKTERDEIAEAFKELTIAVQRMDYARRSRNADGGKPYWSMIEEMTARLFESYVYNKFEALGRRSPLLVRKDTLYDEIEDEINKNAWPYPSKEENETIKPYFDRLFAALQEREDEKGNVLLFRRGGTLMGLHNISEDKLTKAIKTGGLANPSAAVIDINTRTHDNFGEISLLMPSSLVDSETGQNAGTYTGDAWSPTYPGTRRIMSEDGNALYQKDLRDLPEGIRSQVALYYSEHLESDRTGAALAWWFLQDTGRTPDVVRIGMEIPAGLREKLSPMLDKGFWEIVEDNGSSRMLEKLIDQFRFYGDEDEVARASKRMEPREGAAEFVKRRLAERNAQIDQYGVALSFVESFFNRNKNRLLHFGEVDMNDTFLKARQYVDQNDLGSEFTDWLQDRDDRYSVETKLFDGYDENGDPRLFDNTVENASMLMNNERETNSYDNGGLSATRSALLKRLRTLSDIRKNRASLSRDIDDEEWKRVEDQLFSIISRLADMQQISDNQFTNIDLAETRLQEALASRNPVSYLNAQYGYRIPSKGEFADDLRQFIEDARALPVKFFEVKFQRPVHLNEFAAAVVPSDISEESRKALTDAGLPIYEYGENMSRQDATMSASEIEGIRFSRAFHGSGQLFDAFDHSHMGEGEGAQAHGWGTYVAFNEETAKGYATRSGRTARTGDRLAIRDSIRSLIQQRSDRAEINLASGKRHREWVKAHPEFSQEDKDRHLELARRLAMNEEPIYQSLDRAIHQRELLVNSMEQGVIYRHADMHTPLEEMEVIADATFMLNNLSIPSRENFLDYYRYEYNNTWQKGSSHSKAYEFVQSTADGDWTSDRHLYEVEVPNDNGENYIHESDNAKLTDVAEVWEALWKIAENDTLVYLMMPEFREFNLNHTGKSNEYLYDDVARILGSKKEASKLFESIGYVGIIYNGFIDGECAVIFNEKDAKITNHTRFRKAYHGTGADFEAFDHSHVGEGEGLQVHGWGTYVTFDENTGRKYARQVGGSDDQYGRAIRSIDNQIDRDKASLARAKNEAERIYYSDAIALAERRRDEMARHLYIVDIPDDTGENYIDEMKTLSKDGRRRIAAVVRELPEDKLDRTLHGPNWLPQGFKTLANVIEREQYAGMEIRQRLEDALGNTHQARKETSSILHQAGFVGMTYDGRQDGPSAVIFDEGDLKITDHIRFRRSPQRPASFTEEQDGEKTTEKPVGVAFTSPEDTGGRLDTDGITDANIQTFFEKAKKNEDKVKIDPSFIGRQLTKDEIATTIEAIERIASPRPTEIPFTRENYDKLFSNGKITPIGKVKMGDGQFEKFVDLGRTNQLAMADETLRNPDLIIEKPSTAREGQKTERPSSFIFVKAFDNPGGKPKAKIIYYNSISAKRDGLEVVMSNYETNRNRVKNDIEKGKLTYVNSVALSSESGNSVQGDQFAIPAGDDFSKSEVTNNSEKNNVSTNKSASHNDTERFRTSKQVIQAIDRKGLADVIGDENVPEYYNNLYRAIPEEIRESVINRLGDTGLDFHRAMRTHLSDLAFNGIQNDESGLLRLAGTMLQDYIDGDVTLGDRALEYIFWRIGKESDLNDSVDIAINTYLRSRAENEQPSIRFRKGELAESLEAAGSATESAAQQAQETLDEKKKALKGNLLTTAKAMAAQKEYDQKTVDAVKKLAQTLIKEQNIDTMSRREINRILGIVTTSMGKAPKTVKKYADILVDLIIDHLLRSEEQMLSDLANTKASKVNATGVEVQGKLDIHGQNVLKAYKAGLDMVVSNEEDEFDELTIKGRMAALADRLSSPDDAVRSEAEDEYNGLALALEYHENIKASRAEEKSLNDEMKEAANAYRDGELSRTDYSEFMADAESALRENRVERIEAYRELRAKMAGVISGSIDAASQFREREKQRIEEIHHLANSDMQGQSASEDQELTQVGHLMNSAPVRFLTSPLATFDQMLRLLGRKSVSGEGYLWNKFMREGWTKAAENAYLGQKEAKSELDKKVSEVFGRDMIWSDLYDVERKMPTVKVKWWDGGEKKEHELTQGNLLYIYMVNKMADGRMKLRRMGIDESDVKAIEHQMDERFLRLADWLQSEYLVEKRNKYNAVHEQIFGASMAAIDNYFPLKINKRSLNRAEDIGKADDFDALPATTTGSIIKRRRNAQNLDLLNADAFSVVIEHIDQMEQWAAFAEFNKDLNTLLSYKRFRNQIWNMTTVYGSGKELWDGFKVVCSIAGNSYRGESSKQSRWATSMAKGVTSAKIALRVFTALKQFLSMPAFLADANVKYLGENLASPYKAWKWGMENLPLLEKRWKSRIAGDTRLMTNDADWEIFRKRTYEKLSRIGMLPNAFVDALTCAIGSRAMYQSKYDRYIAEGYSEAVADKKAKQDATIFFNETQQSSEGAFVSRVQLDRDWTSVGISVFRNSSFGYQRQLHDALRNLSKRNKVDEKESIEFMAKQMVREGLTEEQAAKAAEKRYEHSFMRELGRVATFGFFVEFLWNLGAPLVYILFGNDDDEKQAMLSEALVHALAGGFVEGLAGGNVISELLNMIFKGEKLSNYDPSLMPIISDLKRLVRAFGTDKVAGMYDLIGLGVQIGMGVNPETISDAVVAIVDACEGEMDTAREAMLLIMRVLQVPQSQLDEIYIDELGTDARGARRMTYREMAERYANYKLNKDAGPLRWAYSDELEKKREKAYLKSFKKKVNERKEPKKK